MCSTLMIGILSVMSGIGVSETGVELQYADRVEAGGQIRVRLGYAYQRLCDPPLNDPEFVLSDIGFIQPRRFTHYSGDVSGRMLGALTAAGAILRRDTPMIDVLTEAFKICQHPDGHYGADQNLAEEINQKRDMPILWGNGRLLLALAERCRDTKDKRLLKQAKRLGEYVRSTRPYYGKEENFKRVGGQYSSGFTTCYPSLIDGLAALGEAAGDKRFYDEARFISRLSLLDTEFVNHHSHGRLTAYRGMLDLDRLTGTREFLDTVRSGCRTITDQMLMPTGGVNERFGRQDRRDEGCSEADWIRVNFLLWQATGDTAYLEAAEHAIRNHLYATQFVNGGFGHHDFRTLKDGDKSYPLGGISHYGSEAYWCCSMHGAQVLADIARWGVIRSGNKIMVTWLSEGGAEFKFGKGKLYVATKYNGDGKWVVLFSKRTPEDLIFSYRVPSWAEKLPEGDQKYKTGDGWIEYPEMEGGNNRTYRYGYDFEISVRLAGVYKSQPLKGEPVRVFAGPDMYCLPDAYIAPGLIADDVVPAVILAAAKPSKEQIPVIIKGTNDRTQQANLVSMYKRPPGGCRYLFNVEQVTEDNFEKLHASATPQHNPGKPIILNFAGTDQHHIYLNGQLVRGHANFDESPLVDAYTNRKTNVLAVRARTDSEHPGLIGYIRTKAKVIPMRAEEWTAVPCPRELTVDWLTDPAKGAADAVKLVDMGGFDSPPWEPLPAQFAGTNARWVWPADATSEQNKKGWLFRYQFDLSP
ncbi:MAG: glycoside hydrolase family 127 protein [Planctomycetota bacterium]|nr:MAG: glycoside hydrolase family 127 protein [Planctomycetota bacterium]